MPWGVRDGSWARLTERRNARWTIAGSSHVPLPRSKTNLIAIEHGRVTAIKRKTIRRLAAALGVEPWDVAEFRRALSGDEPAAED
jgi:hypothetical protein